jgi:hypothetical protein
MNVIKCNYMYGCRVGVGVTRLTHAQLKVSMLYILKALLFVFAVNLILL